MDGRISPTGRWTRSSLERTIAERGFFWATGIEDTFVAEAHATTSRILDEYALTGHYDRWSGDLELAAQLNVSAIRYGLPWYRVNPERNVWDWEFADKTLEKLLDLGLNPIVDLVHYGTPSWMERSFLNPDYPEHVAEYAGRVAERFKGRISWYTPLNEPRINAYYCGKLGYWPPHAKGWSGFLRVLINIAKGIVRTCQELSRIDSEIVQCHVDATDLYDAIDDKAYKEAQFRQEIVFLALDLVTGSFSRSSHLYDWVEGNGVSDEEIDWFERNAVKPDVIGINLYPMFSHKRVSKVQNRTRFAMPYTGTQELVARLGRMYWDRYSTPMFVSETASDGSVKKRTNWLSVSLAGCRHLRSEGIPLIGYTWWPMFSLVAWSYFRSSTALDKHIVHMGLWDLDSNLDRVATPLVKTFADLAHGDSMPDLFGGNAYVS